MRTEDLLSIYEQSPRVGELEQRLRQEKAVQLKGFVGSGLSFSIGGVSMLSGGVHLIVCEDRDAAAYFFNDMEHILKGKAPVFYYPYSYKVPYEVEVTENANIALRGEVLKAFCVHCGHKTQCHDDLSTDAQCANCNQTSGMRPDIVWFGEMPYHMDQIFHDLQNCDLFLSIGTSGNVYPAAGFVSEALNAGAYTIELNLDPANNASAFHEQIYGPAGTTLPELVEVLLA